MAEPDLPRFAHFEGEKVTSLYDLYTRHAEVARDIHQDSLRRLTGNNALTVDLVRDNPIIPQNVDTVIDSLHRYDVVSVSTYAGLGSLTGDTGIYNREIAQRYRQAFAERDMPVYIVASANNGQSKAAGLPRVADFARNSLVVGEANMNNGSLYVEQHSSRINPTLSADSPFNRGVRYQMYDVSPSLTGHEDLIRNWIINQEVEQAFKEFKEQNKDENLDRAALQTEYIQIENSKYNEYLRTEDGQRRIAERVQGYMANPETLHAQVMAELRKTSEIDANGFTTDVDGTSFAAPEQAGCISGAIYEQSLREDRGRPVLNKDEITSLAKMATIDTTAREGEADPMPSRTNGAGHAFVEGGGHGVFQPEMFRALLDEAYKRIETNPDIDRNSVTAVMSVQVGENHNGNQPLSLKSNLPEGSPDVVIDRTRLDMTYSIKSGLLPHEALIKTPGQPAHVVHMQASSGSDNQYSIWAREEEHFGEGHSPDDSWEVRLVRGGDVTVQSAEITVYGYNKGGLMDQMMDYSKELAAKMAPKPEVDPAAPALDNAIDQSIPPENRLTADPPPGPR
ncbi:MAG: hypothetical protein KDI90_07005 [Alphaproteobacteria bacterium]|nr:hypothetical protein [Alphaproteobacteria bacterium]MCB9974395.1 hypothetical protein [Rhodospirillales bacterium]